jgi:folate-binding protein YgfZ
VSSASFCELHGSSLIAFRGDDAISFLHGQLTSDVAGMRAPGTQYSGYCSAKGRLIAALLVWRSDPEVLLQLPRALHQAVQARLTKYVLRARVMNDDASDRYTLFGIAGRDAKEAAAALDHRVPTVMHDVTMVDSIAMTLLPGDRYLLRVASADADRIRPSLARVADSCDEVVWSKLEIETGIPLITPRTQEEFVPQMVNLDLIGGVSYSKGCYPGQEIVARTHYLGRLKQRMYRIRMTAGATPAIGDPLYSAIFGADQAAGMIIATAPTERGYDALAVIQTNAIAGGNVRWNDPAGPVIELMGLPYTIPS